MKIFVLIKWKEFIELIMKYFITILLFFALPVFAIVPPQDPLATFPLDIQQALNENPALYSSPKHPLSIHKSASSDILTNQARDVDNPARLYIPVLCAQYSDIYETEWETEQLQQKFFGEWESGSLKDYYLENSYGALNIDGQVYGWSQVTHPAQYYDRENSNMGDLLTELFTMMDDSVDFGMYDNDGPDNIPNSGDDDGFVDVVFVVHSGKGAEETGGPEIWSHFLNYSFYTGSPFETRDVRANNKPVYIDDYLIIPAVQRDGMVEIGVAAHELGHAFMLPDLYDLDYSSMGVGVWCLMGSGSWGGDRRSPERPVHLSAWCKERLGWLEPVVLAGNVYDQTIPPIEESPVAYKLMNNGELESYVYENHLGYYENVDKEYFLIENRQQKGFDSGLPGSGLLVWHIDHTVSDYYGNTNDVHRLVDLEEADGLGQLDNKESNGDSGDPFPGRNVIHSFTRYTTPNSLLYDGNTSRTATYNVFESGEDIVADLHTITPDLTFDRFDLTNKSDLDNILLPGDDNIGLYVYLQNNGMTVEWVDATLSSDDPYVTVNDETGRYTRIVKDDVLGNKLNYFVVSVAKDSPIHPIQFNLDFETSDGYTSQLSFTVNMEKRRIFLVDDSSDETDDNGNRILDYYTEALDQMGDVEYDVWSVLELMNPTRMVMWEYDIVIWFTGTKGYTLTSYEMANFRNIMYLGGKVLLSGENFGSHLLSELDPLAPQFFTDWMHADLVSESVPDTTGLRIEGIPGNAVSGDFVPYIELASDMLESPSIIRPDSLSKPLFYYNDPSFPEGCSAITYDGRYRLVYLAFGFEAVGVGNDAAEHRALLMKNIVDWLKSGDGSTTDTQVENSETIKSFKLYNNYPNPFNGETQIRYKIDKTSLTNLSIYDVTGKKVRTLVQTRQAPGEYSVQWDGRNDQNKVLPTGVYFSVLNINGERKIKKMALVK